MPSNVSRTEMASICISVMLLVTLAADITGVLHKKLVVNGINIGCHILSVESNRIAQQVTELYSKKRQTNCIG